MVEFKRYPERIGKTDKGLQRNFHDAFVADIALAGELSVGCAMRTARMPQYKVGAHGAPYAGPIVTQ
ncbi:hypothetical protein C7A17_09935 [Ectopseudomonas mendocina]|uniref:Uncharacterized protein n=1 Tax=Ectopseudomonas mendocina TaxID=300 RepID=A0A2R3QMX3_ECTME|nr:hypothetical protein C7A17_09935 [Pseudomonas mendocina]